MTTTNFVTAPSNPYLVEHSQAVATEPLSPWAPQIVPAVSYRVKALTKHNLEELCRVAHRHVGYEATKYEGSRVTDELATEMTGDVIVALETLRLALITAGHEAAHDLGLDAIEKYFLRHVGKRFGDAR